ncbi:hypothetical protein QUF99_12815 [Bacillus sp. DX4.1]|uniref:hypothetical protein n=1 Tax=Bacillus sp. DX4.1 TaxID=3055867 RepID=UPI0025A2C03A|nr:hypothetical protein [Bacillus sp. DX4.1]MDM5188165.1 hypothetical protein [Bacillus sp. DX4.1]
MGKIQELELKIKHLEEQVQWRDNHIKEINEDNTTIIEQAMEAARFIEIYDKFILTMDLQDELRKFLKEEQ